MFGFIRPLRSELKVREWERFQSVYCGLCHSIRQRYGLLQTTLLSYDCTYLALVLDAADSQAECEACRRRCIVHPIRRRSCAQETAGIRHAAAVSVILNWHKLQDTIDDETGWKRLGARVLRLFLRRGYKKARQDNAEFDRVVTEQLQSLNRIQREQTASLDIPADTFANILRAAVPEERTDDGRILGEMFYHTGRWIYLIDACDDLAEDFTTGSYNPVRLRYRLTEPDLTPLRETLRHTLLQSLAASYHAYILLNTKRDGGIIENILCQGLPEVTRQVLNGTLEANGGKNRHGSI
ncbi:MAG: DUF5685 family protein [Eubacteriales bacterium]|nr:DUF5685 family protein [Eubacteriales bacterium]